MAHSHLVIKHLLKQLESFAEQRPERDVRPEWLSHFVQQVAELFAPLSGVGRVGYECQFDETCWEARMYLGTLEIVGGKEDGQAKHLSFEFDLHRMLGCFSRIEGFAWNVFSSGQSSSSFLTVQGLVGDNPVRLKLYSRPPQGTGPALRQHLDGRCEPV